jgi:hypothetical protein
MSTDPYPDVSGDESGIVPNHSNRGPEWPKKIRTLTAAELDRLTIDGAGRFYWDGKLVTYEPPSQPRHREDEPSETLDPTSLDMPERETYDMDDEGTPEPIEGAEIPGSVEARSRSDEHRAVDLDDYAAPAAHVPAKTEVAAAPAAGAAMVAPAIYGAERMRIKLSRWQALGAVIIVLCVVLGATGVAAFGLVAAHDWGCRVGLITDYCPPSPALEPPTRHDIPA